MSRNITDLHPKLQEKVQLLATKCKEQELIIGIGECLRTVEEQDALYAQGRTKPGNIVTNAKGSTYSSQHQWGVAFDFYRNDGTGAFNESDQFFERVGAVGKSLGLGWGGDWTSMKDRPHLYLPDWGSTTKTLKSSYGTPEKFKATWGVNGMSSPEKTKETPDTTVKAEQEKTKQTKKEWIKKLQSAIGAKVDGIAGNETLSKSPLLKYKSTGQVVILYQEMLNDLSISCGSADGIFGTKTKNATIAYQQNKGLVADGIVGKKTWGKILGIN